MTNVRPLAYEPAVEHPKPDEAVAVASINTSIRGVSETWGRGLARVDLIGLQDCSTLSNWPRPALDEAVPPRRARRLRCPP